MRKFIDVTKDLDWNNPDDECLPVTKCVCGAEFSPWKFFISIYDDTPYACPKCGSKFFWRSSIKIFQVVE